jgi:hypothetical protein
MPLLAYEDRRSASSIHGADQRPQSRGSRGERLAKARSRCSRPFSTASRAKNQPVFTGIG